MLNIPLCIWPISLKQNKSGGKGGMIWENSTATYTLLYAKQTTSASSMHEAGTQSRTTQRDRPPKTGQPRGIGQGRKWEGGSRWGGDTVADSCWWKKPSQYYKVIILQLNKCWKEWKPSKTCTLYFDNT